MRLIIKLIILSLPNLLFGQGFVLLKSNLLNEFNAYDVNAIEAIFHQNKNLIALDTDSLLYIIDLTSNGQKKIESYSTSSMKNYMQAIQKGEGTSYYYFEGKDDNIIFKKNNSKKGKKIKIENNSSLVINYSFQDDNFLYFISYYNNNSITILGHDLVRFYKVSKKTKKVVLSENVNVGKEVILAPLNNQLIGFNGEQFIIGSSIKNELYVFDNMFNALDTIILQQDIKKNNILVFDSIFPDTKVNFYLHNPKQLIYDYRNSKVGELKTLSKVLFINKTTLLLSYELERRKKHIIEIYDIPSQEVIREIDVDFSGDKLSNFCWTTKIYKNDKNELVFVNTRKKDTDSSIKFHADIYKYSQNSIVNKSMLSNYNLFDLNNDNIDIAKYSGVILADDYLCKGCYSNYGIGEGVLVILKAIDKFTDLGYYSHSTKKNWGVNGGLVFINHNEYDILKTK